MTQLFVLDVDGCISFPFKPPEWKSLQKIRDYNAQSSKVDYIPALSLCTGRPHPYAECVAQWMGISKPFIFESGGGMYNPKSNQLKFNPLVESHHLEKVEQMKDFFNKKLLEEYPEAYQEFSKRTDCGIVHADPLAIQAMMPKVQDHMKKLDMMHEFEMHHTDISINVILSKCNKGEAIKWLAQELDLSPTRHIAYIGDSSGDQPALQLVNNAFAPANATSAVRAMPFVKTMKNTATEAVLEAYEEIIQENLKSIKK
jgi:HAD superfamily hydrolase (TIGR01484 family)